MPFVEVFSSPGTPRPEQRDKIGGELVDEPERLYTTATAFVLINEVPDGDWGGIGQVVRFNQIANFVMTGSLDPLSDADVNQLLNAGATWEEAKR